ncbi:hypothetical protein GCM10027075_51650 [Streptomyces heilongjiangensis]
MAGCWVWVGAGDLCGRADDRFPVLAGSLGVECRLGSPDFAAVESFVSSSAPASVCHADSAW